MSDFDFDDVLVGARSGDADAFASLFGRTQPLLLRYLRVLGGGDAEDVASETWVSVIRGLDTFEGDESGFRAWAFAIARHRLLDLRRAQTRRPAVTVGDTLETTDAFAPDAADTALENLGTEWALSLIATLPADQAEAVLLRVVGGIDAGGVGVIMDRTSGAVRVLTHRGLRTLAERLAASASTEV